MTKKDRVGQRPYGWGLPSGARKYHYFENGRSLCGKYAWFDRLGYLLETEDDNPTEDDCTACRRAMAR